MRMCLWGKSFLDEIYTNTLRKTKLTENNSDKKLNKLIEKDAKFEEIA